MLSTSKPLFTSKSTPDRKIDDLLPWDNVLEVLEWAKTTDKYEPSVLIREMISKRQAYLSITKDYDDIIRDYYNLLKEGKL